MSIWQRDIDEGQFSLNAFLVLSLGIHLVFLGGAVLVRWSSPSPLPHLQSIIVEIDRIDSTTNELKPRVKEPARAEPAPVPTKSDSAVSSRPVTPVQPAEMQPPAKKEEMVLQAQTKTVVTAPPAAIAPAPPADLPPKPPLQQAVAAAGTAAKGVPQQSAAGREYTALIRGMIDQQKEYPLMARKAGTEGTVYVRFALTRDGRLKRAEVSRSSGRIILDKAAVNAVKNVARFPPVPDALEGAELNFELPLLYKIDGN
jgi:periplasmic protein TonB